MTRLAVFIVTLCVALAVRAEPYSFAELQWGANKEEVAKQLRAKGFLVSDSKGGDIQIAGVLVGYKALGFAMFGTSGLAKVGVSIATPENKALSVYRDMKDTLTKKYGEPESTYQVFVKPYYEGDGYAEQAIRRGKGHFMSMWKEPATKTELGLQVTERLEVMVIYEAPTWAEETAKRKEKAVSVF